MTTGTPPPTRSAQPRRSRVRRFTPLAILVWIALEIWLLTLVAGAIGGLGVFLLIVAGIVVGAVVIKRAGRRAFRALSETLQRQSGATPHDTDGVRGAQERSDGNALVMLGGLFLMVPGMISDVAGLLLLVPPVRNLVRRYAEGKFEKKLAAASSAGGFGDAFQQAQQSRMRGADGKVVRGEVIRDDHDGGDAGREGDEGPRPPLTR
ncbi:FxsA family membrane protein [Streptomyces tsukubensis]|uniref:FxsA family protein n=1 Tax=Streptomyces tsukubensis TaxID=83656 RepID=A0A1V3ZZM5_9ACTN|nr:FxsA family membrane protein [Streptomyces tsukubensis]OON71406.1 hypothetical protein B1H18_33955 [Streptomyces tsukubensis]QFR92504.1 FxsA family protein [Streptomyces tsukubensis]